MVRNGGSIVVAGLLAAVLLAAGTSISNVGPGLGPVVGPSSTFQEINDPAKWILCVAMLLGRLEIFTLLVLFTPAFWRK